MFFLCVNIEGFQRAGAELFCSNSVINGSQAILEDIHAHNVFFRISFYRVTIFSRQRPSHDRGRAKNKQRIGPIVTGTVNTIQVRTINPIILL
jgi:hypothetical protein